MNKPLSQTHKAMLLIALLLLLMAAPIWLYKNNSSNAYADCEASGHTKSTIMANQRLNPLQLFIK